MRVLYNLFRFFPAYTFTWCSSTSISAGVKRYLRYISSGSCFHPSCSNFSSSSFSSIECSTTTTGSPERSSSRFPCFFFGFRRWISSCPSVGSSTETTSASLKDCFLIKAVQFFFCIFESHSVSSRYPSGSIIPEFRSFCEPGFIRLLS